MTRSDTSGSFRRSSVSRGKIRVLFEMTDCMESGV